VNEAQHSAVLTVAQTSLAVDTDGRGFVDITARAGSWLGQIAAGSGTLTFFIRHTSASLVVQENTDPDVQDDLAGALERLAPEGRHWRHDLEGPDDMPAHVKSMLTTTSLTVPVTDGRLALGTWQAIYVAEHRRIPHRRNVVLSWIGTRRT
jgi:secondary thiamine-phosphate synthase enzyme